MDSPEPPEPPNYKPLMKKQMKIAKAQFAWQKDQMEWAKQQYLADREVTNRIIDQSLEINERNAQWAAEDRERYKTIYQPLEDKLIAEAESYASPERIDYEMGRAQSGVAQAYDAQRNQNLAMLESYGIDPSQARYQALDIGMRTAQGSEMAGAANMARDKTEALGRAMRSEAINIGKGYPGQIAGTYGTALAAGNQAVNAGLATTASGANTMGTPVQYGGLANQGYANASNTMNNMYANQINAYQAEQQASSGLGGLLGVGAGLFGRFMGFDDGGAVPDDEMIDITPPPQQALPTPGGNSGYVSPALSPSGGQEVDDVSARLNAGEFVIPKEVVEFKGEEFFHKLISKTKQDRERAVSASGAEPEMREAIPEPPRYVSGGAR